MAATEEAVASPAAGAAAPEQASAIDVFRNRPFLLLWLSQAATQIGGNMVLYGLTVIVFTATNSNAAVSLLILSFLVPAVVFSAVAGVYVDRLDRRLLLVVTNVLRAAAFVGIWLIGPNLAGIYLLNIFNSTVTTFFAPAEAAMIPVLVPRGQLLAANGIFTLTLNAAFAIGYALLGGFVVTIAGTSTLLLVVAFLYLVAAVFCFTLPQGPKPSAQTGAPEPAVVEAISSASVAMRATLDQLREGVDFLFDHRSITWSLGYLGIAASLVGVVGVMGPAFVKATLGLAPKDLGVVVLPLGLGIVTGILLLNSYGRYVPRRRIIEGGLIALGLMLGTLTFAGTIAHLLQRPLAPGGLIDVGSVVSLLSVVVVIAFLAGVAYAFVAIPSQTQLQEELPHDVRGRVFGVLNMLVSIASFVPIIVVGPLSDLITTNATIILVALLVSLSGVASVVLRGPLRPVEAESADRTARPAAPVDTVAVVTQQVEQARLDREASGEAVPSPGQHVGAGAGQPPDPPSPGEPRG